MYRGWAYGWAERRRVSLKSKQCGQSGSRNFWLRSCARIRCCRRCALRIHFTCSIAVDRQRYMAPSWRRPFIPGVLATPAGGILADRGRHREVLVSLGIALMTASLLSVPMKRSLPLAVVVVAILCVQYGVQSLLKPMLQIETVRMAGEEKVERATALVSQMTMVSNILGPVVGTQSMGALASMLFAQPRRWRLRFQLSCLGSHSSKTPHLKR